jgi:hypothetical protein
MLRIRCVGGPSDGTAATITEECQDDHDGSCCYLVGNGLYELAPGWPGAPETGDDGTALAYWMASP